MDSAFGGEAKPSQLIGYGDDPLAIAMAQSGIETADHWSFLDLRPEPGGGGGNDHFGPVTSSSPSGAELGHQMMYLQAGEEQRDAAQRLRAHLEAEEEGEDEEEDFEDDEEFGEEEDYTGADGDADHWLSGYYLVDEDDPEQDEDADQEEEQDVEPEEYTDLSPTSVLPRLVASLGWTDAGRRPPYTFEELAALAICSSPDRQLTARLAAQFVRQVYPFYRQHEHRLQASLEQALFAGPFFRRVAGGGPLSRPWTVTVEGERRLAEAVHRRLGSEELWRPARPVWQEDHSYAAEEPGLSLPPVGRRRVKLATKT